MDALLKLFELLDSEMEVTCSAGTKLLFQVAKKIGDTFVIVYNFLITSIVLLVIFCVIECCFGQLLDITSATLSIFHSVKIIVRHFLLI